MNRLDRIRDVRFGPSQGLVIDEAFLDDPTDYAKTVVDLSKTRDIVARNKTPRILSTNWPWDQFWPKEVREIQHHEAIIRRVLWIEFTADIRRQMERSRDEESENNFF